MYRETFQMFAGYNAWANERLYTAIAELSPETFVADRGLFFGSLMRTLNHLLATDRIWMKRFTGAGEAPNRLDAILHEAFGELRSARKAEDARLGAFIDEQSEADFAGTFTYQRMTDTSTHTQMLAPALFHLFNHQTHHRGQCHAALTGLGRSAPSLDMVAFQRG
ncbi:MULTISPECIES: DinB family protein [unclassified Aureimonas]|uniref:DinB family protein n=1 Tax=unclassified Aureimonas TaxID=2615206 RepID=UPI0006FA79FA|nr:MULTISPECIES: DinB family protein [unclassified Aureimonas]KQT52938.1 diguanylate cyclase [Aureimonas sp. Leaf427]KQT80397.1 diguanylate cyclase [Aureimonas sp. Leaf460]